MRKSFIILVISIILFFSMRLCCQDIPIFSFNDLKPYLNKSNDTTYVINFWATWCIPCVKEIPVFNKLHEEFKNKELKILLVSLDFPSKKNSRLIPFIAKQNIKPEIVLLDEPNANAWIDKVSPEWSGAIPGTLIYNKHSRSFYEKVFTYEELESIINLKIIKNEK